MQNILEKIKAGNVPYNEAVLVVLGFCKGRLSGAGCNGCPAKTEYSQNGNCAFIGAPTYEVESIAKKILTEVTPWQQ